MTEWKIPRGVQPKPDDFAFPIDAALAAVLAMSTVIPSDAFTADTLGTERAGNAVLIRRDGIVLTIGYLITEAESVWLTQNDGRVVQGDVIGFDAETGFGLVQALGAIDAHPLALGSSKKSRIGDPVVIGGAGGRARSIAAKIMAKQEFAGYWEYLLDEAIFTSPAHPHWGGTALIDAAGALIGIGSLQLQQEREGGGAESLNMVVPIDLLKPILTDMLTTGRPNKPARPWLGVYAAEIDDHVVVAGLANKAPAEASGLQVGDILVAAAGQKVDDLASLFRRIWSLGGAGVEVPLRVLRSGRSFDIRVTSTDRSKLLKRRSLH